MHSRAAAASLAGFSFLSACVDSAPVRGPLPTRNQHPAQLTVMHLEPVAASALPAGDFTVHQTATYSSLFLSTQDASTNTRFHMDGENLDARTRLRVGLGRDLEAAVLLPLAHTSGGFLDNFLIDWHRTFGMPDQGRTTAPRDEWNVQATRQGQTAFEVDKAALAIEDVPLEAKWTVVEPGRRNGLGLALRTGLELPTGDADRGFGNGGIDYAVGAAGEWRWRWCTWSAQASHTFAATPDRARAAGLDFADVSSGGIGIELPLGESLALLLQTEYETSTLRELGLRRVAKEQQILWAGARWAITPCWQLEAGFGEDLRGYVSPDFSAYLGMVWVPAARR